MLRANWVISVGEFLVSGDMTMRTGTVARRRALFEEAVDIIEREFPQPLGLDDVARRLATSRRQLQRAFAEIGGARFRAHVSPPRQVEAVAPPPQGPLAVREGA